MALVALVVGLLVTSEYADALYTEGGFVRTALLTALVIAAVVRPGSQVGAVLGRAPLVWLGQRSYGIYLYHWPIFVLTRPGVDVPGPTWLVDVARITATLAVAELSYRLVEMPVRRGALRRWAGALRHGVRWSPPAGLAAVGLLVATLTLSCGPQVAVPGAPAAAPAASPAPAPASAATLTAPSAPTRATVAPPAITSRAAAPPSAGGALVVGDSVVLGSADALEAALGPGATVDGRVGRQFDRGPAIVEAWTATHPGPVVVHLGSNGIVRDDDVQRVVDATRGRTLVFVTVAVPRRWQEPDNEVLAQTAADHPGHVVLVDWAALVTADPSLLGPDHVHPDQRGREALAAAIRAGLGR